MEKKESNLIFATKGIGILLVVIAHFNIPEVSSEYYIKIREVIYYFHMPLFMLLAGFLFAYRGDSLSYSLIVSKKMKRLMLPYFTITLLLLLAKGTAGLFFTLKHPVDAGALSYIFLNPSGGFSTLLWFIYTLFIIFLLFPLLNMAIKNQYILLLLVIVFYFLPWPKYFCVNHVFHYLPFFTFGYILKKNSLLDKIKPYWSGGAFLAAFAVGLMINSYYQGRVMLLALGVLGCMVCISMGSIIVKGKMKIADILITVGIYSSSIYLLHTFFTGTARIALFQILDIRALPFMAAAFLVLLPGILGPILLDKYLMRKNQIFSKFILGIDRPAS